MTFAVSTDIITNGMGETIMTDQIGILTRGGGGLILQSGALSTELSGAGLTVTLLWSTILI